MRRLLLHRSRLVQLRTRVQNQLDAVAKNEGLLTQRGWSEKRRQAVETLPLAGWQAERRKDLLALLDEFNRRIRPLNEAVSKAAAENMDACRLMTHPGVGPIVALAYVLALCPPEASSSDKRRLGHISKQGNGLVRWLLVEAATIAQRHDPSWHRQYVRLSMSKHHGVAKVAIAHKLAVRLYWMVRSVNDYEAVKEPGSHAGESGR